MDFVKQVASLKYSRPLNDFTDETFKATINSLVKSYQKNKDEHFASEVLYAHEALFIKQAKRVNNYHDREDMIVFMLHDFYKLMDEYDPELSSFTYILDKRLAWSRGKFLEREMLQELVLVDHIEFDMMEKPEEIEIDFVMSYEAHKMLDCLTPKERLYVEDVVIQGLPMTEFRHKHSITNANARKIKSRAIEKLRQAYYEVYNDGIL